MMTVDPYIFIHIRYELLILCDSFILLNELTLVRSPLVENIDMRVANNITVFYSFEVTATLVKQTWLIDLRYKICAATNVRVCVDLAWMYAK